MAIFGIGLPRTGTNSLGEAMELLGFTTCRVPSACEVIYDQIIGGETPVIETDYICEFPLCLIAPLLDMRYPQSKFILTTRAVESWLPSMMNLHATMETKRYGFTPAHVSVGSMKDMHRHFQNFNLQYFRDDPRCLVIPTESLNWEPLCEFLGKPVPDAPFPWLNKLSRKSS